jgi:hypothetical protein
MKQLLLAVALVAGATSVSAFAQQSSQPAPQVYTTAQTNANDAAGNGQWVPPYGQPTTQKTRAQVYQELVQAERDGQLAYLNSTLYAHH